MKTLKSIFVISAMLLVSGYTFATGKGPSGSNEVNNSVREKIAAAIGSADIKAKGQVTLKFGVTDKDNLQILNIESDDKVLTAAVKDALADTKIVFPKGSKGVYTIKVYVNETGEFNSKNYLRDQVYAAVGEIDYFSGQDVKVKFRVVNPSTIQVLKAESADPKLALQVKKAIETQNFLVPKQLSGEYSIIVSFK